MLILNDYHDGIDECWYDSSTVIYTKFVENPNDNNGQLYVTFKGGSTYLYKDVNMPFNYLQFKHGLKENSSGKSLNEYIKPYYKYEKLENISVQLLEDKRLNLIKAREEAQNNKLKTYFISGHRDITENEFAYYYMPALDELANEDCLFVVGDCDGVDIMAQDYLMNVLKISPDRVTVYIIGGEPNHINEMITNVCGGFEDYLELDKAMTEASSFDIAFVRKGKEDSETAMNIIRRHLMA